MTQFPPGPKGLPVVGSLFDFSRDPLSFLQHTAYTYGEIAHFQAGPMHVYLLNSPDYIHDVLVANPHKFEKEKIDKIIGGRVLGKGLLFNDGDSWRRQRKLVQPAFHSKRIQAYAQVMVDKVLWLLGEWHDGETRDMSYEMTKLTLAIVAKTLFDAEMNDEFAKVSEALYELQNILVSQVRLGVPLPEWLPLPMNRRQKRARQALDEVVLRIIRERRISGEDKGDLLSMLLLAQDEEDGTGMTDEQVRDEVMTLFIAGHETTANALAWTWYLLSQHPSVETRLHAELEQTLGQRSPTLEDLPRLKYVEMVIKESMRLYPPAWGFGRQALENVEIGGYMIPKGSTVSISPYVMHRHPRYFANPERFDPERFSPENEKGMPKYTYIPFGGGPRVCIGNSFAMMEAQLILATIAQRYQLALVPQHPIALEPLVTLRPKYGIQMVLKRRENL